MLCLPWSKQILASIIIDLFHNGGLFNPLSPNSDQRQFSPNDIRTLSRH